MPDEVEEPVQVVLTFEPPVTAEDLHEAFQERVDALEDAIEGTETDA